MTNNYHPLQAGLETCLDREDLLWKGPFRSVFYGLGRFKPTVALTRSLIYVAAPVKGFFSIKRLNQDLGSTINSIIPGMETFPEGSWKEAYLRIGVGVTSVTFKAPVREVEFSEEEYNIPVFKRDDEPLQPFPPGTRYLPDSLTYGGSIFLYPHKEIMERSWQECFKSKPIDEVIPQELQQLQRKYAPTFWQRMLK